MDKDKARADQIQTLLAKGKTPQEIIARGYAKSTVYAVVKKTKPKLDLLPVEKLEERLRCLENLTIQLMSIVRVEDVICPMCGMHPFRYFEEPDDKGVYNNGYKCSSCGYRIEFSVDTLIHELGHHQSGEEDLTEEHSNAITRVGA